MFSSYICSFSVELHLAKCVKIERISFSISTGNSPSNASSQVAYEIDQAVRKIIEECHETAKKIILEHKEDLVKIAEALIANETITAEEIKDILDNKLIVKDGRLVKAEEVETVIDINEKAPEQAPEQEEKPVRKRRTVKKKKEEGEDDKAA